MKASRFLLAAALALAITLTFSCSSGDDNNDDNGGGGGNGDSSSVTGGADGGGNKNAQIYKEDGTTLFTGSGIIEATSGIYGWSDNGGEEGFDWDHLSAGSVTNGHVKLELPQTIPSEYLRDFISSEYLEYLLSQGGKHPCTSYPENIKSAGAGFVLTNSGRDYIGWIELGYRYEQIKEAILYMYFTKNGKIICNFEDGDIINIDAKIGWNKIYDRKTYRNGISKQETSTDNILTKEVKWTIYTD